MIENKKDKIKELEKIAETQDYYFQKLYSLVPTICELKRTKKYINSLVSKLEKETCK